MASSKIPKMHTFDFCANLNGNSSLTITVPALFRGIIYIFRGASVMGQFMVHSTSSGAVNVCVITTFENLQYSTGTGTITFTNNASANSAVFYLGSDGLIAN